jgi:oligopeptide transport system ATP-binding protein
LQKSIPALQPKGEELYTIPGSPPDLSREMRGCPFVPRCEYAQDYCRNPVDLLEVAPGQLSACVRIQRGEIQLT